MVENAKDNLKKSLDELCYANNHLNTANEITVKKHEKQEIKEALKSVENAIVSAHNTIIKYKD